MSHERRGIWLVLKGRMDDQISAGACELLGWGKQKVNGGSGRGEKNELLERMHVSIVVYL